jgi:protein O-mannosyl-transferase
MPVPSAAIPNRSWASTSLMAGLLVLATLLAYQPVWRAEFIWDDDAVITANALVKGGWPGLRDIWASTKFHDYVPLALTSFWLEWRLWGDHAAGYHVVNVLLHSCSAVLLWRVLRRLRVPGAGLAAAIFALHPVNVASVAWITERKNTLAMFLYLASLLCYLRFDVTRSRSDRDDPSGADRLAPLWYGLSLLSFALALLSKTAVAPLPVVLLGLAWWQRGRIGLKDLLWSVPYGAVATAAVLLLLGFHHRAVGASLLDVNDASLAARLAGAGWAVWFYLYKAIIPLGLSFVYVRWRVDPNALLSYVPDLLLLFVLAVCWRYRRGWGRAAVFGLVYFLVMLLPVLGFVNIYFMRFSLVADHWQYFAIIGPIALAAAGLTGAAQAWNGAKRGLAAALGTALVLTLGALTWRQACVYADQQTLWLDTIAKNPTCWMAHNNLGNVLADKGRIDEAIHQYREALRIQPTNADAHNNLGAALSRKGDIKGGIAEFQETIRWQPDHAGAHYNLGAALDGLGQTDAAIRHYRESLRFKPAQSGAHYSLGTALLRKGQTDEAIRELQETLRLQPGNADARVSLGTALTLKGRVDEAIILLREALRLQPNDPYAKHNLAKALEWLSKSNTPAASPRKP